MKVPENPTKGGGSMGNGKTSASNLSDEEIVKLYHLRDEQAIKETDAKYSGYLFTVARNIIGDSEDAAECLNDTYLGAWNRRNQSL